MPIRTETQWNLIIEDEELAKVATYRAKEQIEISIDNSELKTYLNEGYSIKKEGIKKSTVRIFIYK